MLRRTPLRRYTPLRRQALTPKRGRVEAPGYLAWVRTLPCLVAGTSGSPCSSRVEAHHVGKPRNDFRTVPLCSQHHREGPEAMHRIHRRAFEARFSIAVEAVIGDLNAQWLEHHSDTGEFREMFRSVCLAGECATECPNTVQPVPEPGTRPCVDVPVADECLARLAWTGDTGSGNQRPAAPAGPRPSSFRRVHSQAEAVSSLLQKVRRLDMSEILRFAVNVPVEVALASECGKHVEGRYGDQVKYVLADGKVMYVPPYVERRIEELSIGPGEPVEIWKSEVHSGARRWIEWHVKRADKPQQPVSSDKAPAAADSALRRSQSNGNGSTNGTKMVPTGSEGGDFIPQEIRGAGIRAMELALNGAFEIAQRLEARAALRNYPLRFSNDDIRAIGVTLFIQAMRDGGVRWAQ